VFAVAVIPSWVAGIRDLNTSGFSAFFP